ncbi:MAG: restriction endonuclease subunit S [Lachnospiraceae bacterium]|nr:restriction endonuclease subunit S [Lachnospiraceae bacterium]
MSMKSRLGDYIQEYSLRNKAEEGIPVYSVTNTQGFCQGYFDKEVAGKDKSTYKIVPRGCFAYNPSRINVGSVDWQRNEDRVIVSPLYNVFSVSPHLDQQYLYYYLKSDFTLQRIRAVATGSVRDNLKLAMLYEFPIRIPSIEQQKEIVERLDKAKHLISQREQELQTLDELIKARFVEMFGDESNPYNWPVINVEEVADVSVGVVIKPAQYYTDEKHGVKAFRSLNIGPMTIKDGDWVYFSYEGNAKNAKSQLRENDLLIVRSGAPGTACVVPKQYEGCNAIDIIIARPDTERINPYYLCTYTNMPHGKRQIEEGTGGAAQQHFNVGKYNKLRLMLPPMDRQKDFVDFVDQVDKSKVVVQKALDEVQVLFDSLMQQYFG